MPQPLANRAEWKVTASEGGPTAALALDGRRDTQFTTGVFQHPGQWYQIELPQETLVEGVTMKSGGDLEYPRRFKVEISLDGTVWGKPVASGNGTGTDTQVAFAPVRTRFIRITQTAGAKNKCWSMAELQVLEATKTALPGSVAMAAASSSR